MTTQPPVPMTTQPVRNLSLALVAGFLLNAFMFCSARAQVIVESGSDLDFGVATSASVSGTATLTQSFSTTTASSSVLLLLVGSEVGTQTANATASFGAQNFTLVASSNSGSGFVRRAFVFALDLGNETAESANIAINLTVQDIGQGFGAAVMQVSNADFSSLQATAGSSASSPFGSTFSSLPSGSLVFGVAVQNNTPSPIAAGNFTPTGSASQSGFSASMIAAYQTGVSGNFNASYTATGAAQWPYANLEISAIPEPSTVALLVAGLGGLALLRRRRSA